ncbi:protein of unknown function [Nitrospira defluvii]|uniref:Uncharacterized protein n=1 Tax=Nitrospira defluvii TaxID=330214 RepID=D8PDY7_9BACT|nr:protein of unknown function [Nitrospira defluvii]
MDRRSRWNLKELLDKPCPSSHCLQRLYSELYSDFGCPHEIARFVRYMPLEDEYDPRKHSKVENEGHMLEQWRDYLIEAEKKFGFGQD